MIKIVLKGSDRMPKSENKKKKTKKQTKNKRKDKLAIDQIYSGTNRQKKKKFFLSIRVYFFAVD